MGDGTKVGNTKDEVMDSCSQGHPSRVAKLELLRVGNSRKEVSPTLNSKLKIRMTDRENK